MLRIPNSSRGVQTRGLSTSATPTLRHGRDRLTSCCAASPNTTRSKAGSDGAQWQILAAREKSIASYPTHFGALKSMIVGVSPASLLQTLVAFRSTKRQEGHATRARGSRRRRRTASCSGLNDCDDFAVVFAAVLRLDTGRATVTLAGELNQATALDADELLRQAGRCAR